MKEDGDDDKNYKDATEEERHAIGGIDIKALIAATARAVLSAANYAPRASIEATSIKRQLDCKDVGSQIPLCSQDPDEDIEMWITRVDKMKEANGVPEEIIKVLTMKQLRGRARDWYDYTKGTIASTWDVLK